MAFLEFSRRGNLARLGTSLGLYKQITSAEPPSFMKEVVKSPEPAISDKTAEAPKEPKKRIQGLLNVKTSSWGFWR